MTKPATLTCYDISSDSEKLSRTDDFLGEIKAILVEIQFFFEYRTTATYDFFGNFLPEELPYPLPKENPNC